MKFKSIAFGLTSLLLLAGCETNPQIADFLQNGPKPTNTAAKVQAQPVAVQPVQKPEPIAASKEITRPVAAAQPTQKTTSSKPDATGLIGKSIKPVKKFFKPFNTEMTWYNNYMVLQGSGIVSGLPNDAQIYVLTKNGPDSKTLYVAYTKGPHTIKTFVDVIAVNQPKSYALITDYSCIGAHIALFKESNSNSAGNFHSPIKAWSVINEKITEISNISKVTCPDNSDQ